MLPTQTDIILLSNYFLKSLCFPGLMLNACEKCSQSKDLICYPCIRLESFPHSLLLCTTLL